MRIGELSRQTQVPVPTIKYYQREGLLPPGERGRPNQVSYDEVHVRRLRLVRALVEVAALPIARIRELLGVLDAPGMALHDVLGAAQRSLPAPAEPAEGEAWKEAQQRVDELIERRGWRVGTRNPGRAAAAAVLAAWQELGWPDPADLLDGYAEGVEQVAAADLAAVARRGTVEEMVQVVVIGTLLGDALVAALRRLAQEDASARSFPVPDAPTPSDA